MGVKWLVAGVQGCLGGYVGPSATCRLQERTSRRGGHGAVDPVYLIFFSGVPFLVC